MYSEDRRYTYNRIAFFVFAEAIRGDREINVDHLRPETDRYGRAKRPDPAAPRVPYCRAAHACIHACARFTASLASAKYLCGRCGAAWRELIISAVKKINRRQEKTRERAANGGNYRRPRPNGLKNARPQIKVPLSLSLFGVGAICPFVAALLRPFNTTYARVDTYTCLFFRIF